MYCPKCGKQQVMDAAPFCFNCGLGLDDVKRLLKPGTPPTPAVQSQDSPTTPDVITFSVPTPIEDIEWAMITSTLTKTGRNKTRTAELLKIKLEDTTQQAHSLSVPREVKEVSDDRKM
jgi:DNA-binding NtrC family response regulator